MKNAWNEAEAAAQQEEPGALIYATRLLGVDETLGLLGGGNTSAKLAVKNFMGEAEEILFVDHGGQNPATIQADGYTALRRRPLVRLAALNECPASGLENEIACSRTVAISPVPPPEALLHAWLPYRYILFTRPESVLTIAHTPDGAQRLRQVYGDHCPIMAYAPAGLPLAKVCCHAVPVDDPGTLTGLYIHDQGLLTFGESAREAYARLVNYVTLAEQYLKAQHVRQVRIPPRPRDIARPGPGTAVRQVLASIRQEVSNLAGQPLLLSIQADPESLRKLSADDLAVLSQSGPTIAGHVGLIKHWPLIGRDVQAYQAACQQAMSSAGIELPPSYDCGPRVLIDPELGLYTLGRTAEQATLAGRIYRQTIGTILRATSLSAYQSQPRADLAAAALSTRQGREATAGSAAAMFMGEIALVTGGASGIGKACVESLLARGAAVGSIDINPAVTRMYDRPDYLGLVCDLTDEQAVLGAFEALARTFGGLDMLVVNAGIFPAGCRIEALSLAEWQRVMHINLDSNLVVLRESFPLLQRSPRGGRVLVNASKNVLAPGAGAVAYSSSKAAVTQMARVAALEWGKDKIRVNLIHPDAIFDTGIWTEEVLKARAAHYGMTVQQYKTRNVLGVELDSHYVGELVAEMLGPRFEKITGAQIPVDGGSDRVI